MMKTIEIKSGTYEEPKIHRVKAHVYGAWAAHAALNDWGWTVTHAPSGLVFMCPLEKHFAVTIAEYLDRAGVECTLLSPTETDPEHLKRLLAIRERVISDGTAWMREVAA